MRARPVSRRGRRRLRSTSPTCSAGRDWFRRRSNTRPGLWSWRAAAKIRWLKLSRGKIWAWRTPRWGGTNQHSAEEYLKMALDHAVQANNVFEEWETLNELLLGTAREGNEETIQWRNRAERIEEMVRIGGE